MQFSISAKIKNCKLNILVTRTCRCKVEMTRTHNGPTISVLITSY